MRRKAAEKQGSGGIGSGLLRRAAAVQGRNAGHGRGISALGWLRRRCGRNGMKMRGGGGGGGGGGGRFL